LNSTIRKRRGQKRKGSRIRGAKGSSGFLGIFFSKPKESRSQKSEGVNGSSGEKRLSLAEAAEKDEIEYLHQNRRKICSDETTHPTGKVVKNIYAEGIENLP